MARKRTRASKRINEVVIDASLAVNFVLPTYSYHGQVRRLFEEWEKHGVILAAPHLFEAESDSGIRRLVHLKKISASTGAMAQSILEALSVRLIYNRNARKRARQIAEQFNQSRIYDATYASLAEVRRCIFWTADEKFFNAVSETLTFVKFIGNY